MVDFSGVIERHSFEHMLFLIYTTTGDGIVVGLYDVFVAFMMMRMTMVVVLLLLLL